MRKNNCLKPEKLEQRFAEMRLRSKILRSSEKKREELLLEAKTRGIQPPKKFAQRVRFQKKNAGGFYWDNEPEVSLFNQELTNSIRKVKNLK
jgi:hypothetical protein